MPSLVASFSPSPHGVPQVLKEPRNDTDNFPLERSPDGSRGSRFDSPQPDACPQLQVLAAHNDGCSDATLRGDYGFTILGDQPNPDGTTSPVVGVAITHFDGAGKLTQEDFTVDGGVPSPANGNSATGFHFAGGETGTYSVNSDCMGSAEIDLNAPAPLGLSRGAIKLMFIVPADGATIHTVVSEITVPFTTVPVLNTTRSDASRIGGIAGHCSNAILKGDFGSTILGTSPNPDGTTSPLKGVAITEFDGRGKFTQRDFV